MAKLNITRKTVGDKTYANISPKDLDEGESVELVKVYDKGFERQSDKYFKPNGDPVLSFSCVAELDGEQVSFFLDEESHNSFAATGGKDDRVRMIKLEEKYVTKSGRKGLKERLTFELVE